MKSQSSSCTSRLGADVCFNSGILSALTCVSVLTILSDFNWNILSCFHPSLLRAAPNCYGPLKQLLGFPVPIPHNISPPPVRINMYCEALLSCRCIDRSVDSLWIAIEVGACHCWRVPDRWRGSRFTCCFASGQNTGFCMRRWSPPGWFLQIKGTLVLRTVWSQLWVYTSWDQNGAFILLGRIW